MGVVIQEKLPKVTIPTKEDISSLLSKFSEIPGDPAGILLVTENSSNYIPSALKIMSPKPLGVLFKMDYIGKSLPELIEKNNVLYKEISVSVEQREAICSLTYNQSDSKYWFRYRAYQITPFKTVLKTYLKNPSVSLLKDICYSDQKAFKF